MYYLNVDLLHWYVSILMYDYMTFHGLVFFFMMWHYMQDICLPTTAWSNEYSLRGLNIDINISLSPSLIQTLKVISINIAPIYASSYCQQVRYPVTLKVFFALLRHLKVHRLNLPLCVQITWKTRASGT